jgi:hypothetical protein
MAENRATAVFSPVFMRSTFPHLRIPVVAVVCALFFTGYGLWVTEQRRVVCDRLAPQQVQCQVNHALLFGWLPTATTEFRLQDIAIDSTMCDNTPRGGVRFCHRVTLLGSNRAQALPEIRTPLAAATIQKQFKGFMAGEGPTQLSFKMAGELATYIRTGILGLLLMVVAWGFWDIQWPPVPMSPLAIDGRAGGRE